jgi:hypothetical protein
MGQDGRPQARPLLIGQLLELLVSVEHPEVPSGTRVLEPRVMPLRDHLASHGSPTYRARSMP